VTVLGLLEQANKWFPNDPSVEVRVSNASLRIVGALIKQSKIDIAIQSLKPMRPSLLRNTFQIILMVSRDELEAALQLVKLTASEFIQSPNALTDLFNQLKAVNSNLGNVLDDFQLQKIETRAIQPSLPVQSPMKTTNPEAYTFPASQQVPLSTIQRRTAAKQKFEGLRVEFHKLMSDQSTIQYETEETEGWFTVYYEHLKSREIGI